MARNAKKLQIMQNHIHGIIKIMAPNQTIDAIQQVILVFGCVVFKNA